MPESLFSKWRTLPWIRRFQWFSAGVFALITVFYSVENVRGSKALNQAKKAAQNRGWVLDLDELKASREVPDASENFAVAIENVPLENLKDFADLDPEFVLMRHDDYTNDPLKERMARAEPIDLRLRFPKARNFGSEKQAATETLRIFAGRKEDFDSLVNAAQRKHCYYHDSRTNSLFPLVIACDAVLLRSAANIATGQTSAALADIETLVNISTLHSRPSSLLEFMSEVSFGMQALKAIWQGLNQQCFSDSELLYIQDLLSRLTPDRSWHRMRQFEVAQALLLWEELAGSPLKRWNSGFSGWQVVYFELPSDFNLLMDVDGLLNAIIAFIIPNGWFRQSIADGLSEAFLDKEPALIYIVGESRWDFVWGQAYADINVIGQRTHTDGLIFGASIAQAKTAVALERYLLKHSNYPRDFDGLIPEFLDQAPADPWSKQPMTLTFRLDGRPAIYSVGPDLVDDGGVPLSARHPRKGDIVWHYSLPEGIRAK